MPRICSLAVVGLVNFGLARTIFTLKVYTCCVRGLFQLQIRSSLCASVIQVCCVRCVSTVNLRASSVSFTTLLTNLISIYVCCRQGIFAHIKASTYER